MRLTLVWVVWLFIILNFPGEMYAYDSAHSQHIAQIGAYSVKTDNNLYTLLYQDDNSTPEPLPVDSAIGPRDYPEDVNPLTGLPVDNPALLERRPIVVKISNAPPLVRPQSGINQADIVFEHYAEGGLTRFSAIFYGQTPTRVGSIRSARLIDHEIVPMVDGMLVFSGGSIGVETYIYGSDVIDPEFQHAPHRYIPPSEYAERAYKGVFYGLPYYWRDEAIPVPHNMFANLEAVWQLAAEEGHNQRPRLQGLAFHAAPLPEVQISSGTAEEIDIRYRGTRVRWVYDAESGRYLRFADGQLHFDVVADEQISADNVVVMYSEHVDTEIIESQWQGSISWSTQIQMWDQADVVLFRDGQRYDGYWIRTVREDFIALRTNDDEIMYLKPGNTWFQIMRLPEQQNSAEEWLIVE